MRTVFAGASTEPGRAVVRVELSPAESGRGVGVRRSLGMSASDSVFRAGRSLQPDYNTAPGRIERGTPTGADLPVIPKISAGERRAAPARLTSRRWPLPNLLPDP